MKSAEAPAIAPGCHGAPRSPFRSASCFSSQTCRALMPLLHLRYFDDHSKWKDDLNFSTARASYSSAMIPRWQSPCTLPPFLTAADPEEPGAGVPLLVGRRLHALRESAREQCRRHHRRASARCHAMPCANGLKRRAEVPATGSPTLSTISGLGLKDPKT